VLTGASQGIGEALAYEMARQGARLVLAARSLEQLQKVAERCNQIGGQTFAVSADVGDPDSCKKLIEAAVGHLGGLDILINHAGYTWDSVVQKMTDEQWDAILDVHLKAPFRILRAAQPVIAAAVKEARGAGTPVPCRKVVNISSIAGLGGNAGQANYAAAKAGVTGLTKALAKEWGRYNVTVNTVAFGLIRTRLTEAAADDAGTIDIDGREIAVGVNPTLLSAMEQMIPLGRSGTPEEAAGAVYLMCAPESDYVSGQTLVCGGGFMI
jgi:3-oxoacyl-[acyl-carrier protein] reductase